MRKILCFLSVLILLFSLCGCDIFTSEAEELLSPPSLTGDMLPISNAIQKSVGSDYTLEYPMRGDYRSAIIQHDLNNDGIFEAIAFYRTKQKSEDGNHEIVMMNMIAIVNRNGEWVSGGTQSLAAGGIDQIDFCDFDSDGIKEIMVGWAIYGTSELQLSVYSLGENTLTQRMAEQYTHFVPCDLDANDRYEVLILRSFPSEQKNTAHLFSLTQVGVSQISSCELDGSAKTINAPAVSTLSTGTPAVYIDEIKGVGAVTSVLFLEKGQLVNPLLNKDSKKNTKTLREATFESYDINDDGIIEIPVRRDVPTVTKTAESEKLYLTDWCSFNGETLTAQITAMINPQDGYYYCISQNFVEKIAVLKDSENSLMELYFYNAKTNATGDRLLHFKAVKKTDWDSGVYKNQDLTAIINDGETTYVCNISTAAKKSGFDIEKIKSDFKLLKR